METGSLLYVYAKGTRFDWAIERSDNDLADNDMERWLNAMEGNGEECFRLVEEDMAGWVSK